MCGRYYVDESALKEIQKLPGDLDWTRQEKYAGDICPSQEALVIRERAGCLSAEKMIWGFPGFEKGRLLINARAESASERRTFRDCIRHRRCIIPEGGFYEWDKEKTKYSFERQDGAMMFLAGCYNLYEDGHRFVILTTAANPSMEPVHDRMPLILEPGEVKRWLLDDRGAEQILHNTPTLLDVSTEYEQLRLF